MADFCTQCTKEIFDEAVSDFKGVCPASLSSVFVLCEGCGHTHVNRAGDCVDTECLKRHGTFANPGAV